VILPCPQTSKDNALNVARRLHKLVRESTWLVDQGLNIKLTPSVGVAILPRGFSNQGRLAASCG